MKKLFKVLMISTMSMGLVGAINNSGNEIINAEEEPQVEETSIYSPYNHYNYRLDKAFDKSPDCFEAWIKMPANSLGGTIMGNYVNNLVGYAGSVDWSIDAIGQVKIFWNAGKMDHTFKGVYLNDNQWHHVAVFRKISENKFCLAVDGQLKEEYISFQRDSIGPQPMQIGVNYANWTNYKTPFEGKIEQVTVKTGEVSLAEIQQDMNNKEIVGENVLTNLYLGKAWSERKILDSNGNNNAKLMTFEKMVGVVDTGDYDYTLTVVPDIQLMTRYKPDILEKQMRWLAINANKYNMQFAMFLGDLSDHGTMEDLYATAAQKMAILDGRLPYTFVQGNHDYDNNCSTDRTSTYFDRYFPYSKYSQAEGFGGTYEGSMANSFFTFEVPVDRDVIKYCVINLEFGPRMEVIRWAGRICEAFPEHRVIITTHGFMDPDGSIMDENARYSATSYSFAKNAKATTGTQLFDGLVRRYPNIFMTLSGHNGSDDIVYRTDIGDHGNIITSFLIDAQSTSYRGDAQLDMLALFKINEKNKTIGITYYSPEYDACFNHQNQFVISFYDKNNKTI